MLRKIPSTKALIVFEAAARYESFSRAAKELYLTESAVSRQISGLEDFVSRKLFHRQNPRVTLTEAGLFYAEQVRDTLRQLEQKTLALSRHKSETRVIELATVPTFTSFWLLPRMKVFCDRHPDIVVNLSERLEPFSIDGSGFDAAITFEHTAWEGMSRRTLFAQDLIPIVSPDHYDVAKLQTPADLMALPLLHNIHRMDAWDRWARAAGGPARTLDYGARYDLYSMMIDAVRAGLGVGLVPRVYVTAEIERGILVSPFKHCLRSEKTFCLVYPSDREISEPLALFEDWLVKTSADQSAGRGGSRVGTLEAH